MFWSWLKVSVLMLLSATFLCAGMMGQFEGGLVPDDEREGPRARMSEKSDLQREEIAICPPVPEWTWSVEVSTYRNVNDSPPDFRRNLGCTMEAETT